MTNYKFYTISTVKMKWLVFIQILFCLQLSAQNLIQNGDFEQFSTCPSGYGRLDSALYWINPANIFLGGGTSDYFNQCSDPFEVGVPWNHLGYGGSFQLPHSGVAYTGMIIWDNFTPEYREYMETELIGSLLPGVTYKFEMYVSLADVCEYTTNNIQVYFSDTLISGIANFNPLPFIPQIISLTSSYPDTLNWLLLTGNYIAQGGERFIIIGNFLDDQNTTYIYLGLNFMDLVYIYIDDVSLTGLTSINDFSQPFKSNVFPNPFENEISIDVEHFERTIFHLYDNLMREVKSTDFISNTEINTSELSKGIYFYTLKNNKGETVTGKLIKN